MRNTQMRLRQMTKVAQDAVSDVAPYEGDYVYNHPYMSSALATLGSGVAGGIVGGIGGILANHLSGQIPGVLLGGALGLGANAYLAHHTAEEAKRVAKSKGLQYGSAEGDDGFIHNNPITSRVLASVTGVPFAGGYALSQIGDLSGARPKR